MPASPFNTLARLTPPGQPEALFYSLPALAAADIGNIARLPVSLRIVLEALLRHCDGQRVSERHIRELAAWRPQASRSAEIPMVVARVVLQDFTGVP
ncbi:MAG: aconitate hydratase, partial [Candidatus Accumulibacter necessarius]